MKSAESALSAVRDALHDTLGDLLAPLDGAPSAFDLEQWTAHLAPAVIVRCLGGTPAETADNLAAAITDGFGGRADPFVMLAAQEFPRQPHAVYVSVAKLARVLKRLREEHDGTVTADQLTAAGLSSSTFAAMVPKAAAVLERAEAEPIAGTVRGAGLRLRAAGELVALPQL